MSELGHSRQKWIVRATSAFTPIATEPRASRHSQMCFYERTRKSISEFPKFLLPIEPKSLHNACRPGPHRGAFRDRHERRAGDAVDAGGAADEAPARGRRSR